MSNMEEIITVLVKPLVNNQSKFNITKEVIEFKTVYYVHVDKEDMGKVIGKNGRIAQAIRTIIYERARIEGKNIRVNFNALP